jgi:hypothetical protein
MHIQKHNTINMIPNDHDIAEGRIVAGDHALANLALSDGDLSYLFEQLYVFDAEAEAAYRVWEESFLYFLAHMDGR